MQIPLEINWHQVDKSEALDGVIRKHVQKLDELYPNVIACRVTVEKPHERHHQGNLYDIRVLLKVPEKDIVVHRNQGDAHAHEDPYVTVRDAFDAVRRQLEDYARKRRGEVKAHASREVMHLGKVLRKFDDYGFLVTPDAREVYFEANDVFGMPYENLQEGAEVSFIEEMGEKGPHAKRVLTGKHGLGL